MPALFAHNKFGKLVIKELPAEIKTVIRKYPNPFRIGLQGPDLLFFYKAFSKNFVNQHGVFLHHSDAHDYMTNALDVVKKYGMDSPEFSYIVGFICHFTLDNACHPYINESMGATKCGHIEIEGDLEHLLLTMDGHKPESYPMYKLVPTDYDTAKSISHCYQNLTPQDIITCMRWMRFIKRVFVAPGRLKQKLFDCIFRATMHYKSFRGHVLENNANKKCRKNTEHIYQLLLTAVPTATDYINNFVSALNNPELLSADFHCDFNGNSFI